MALKLKDLTIRSAKSREKPYKLADGGGLYVEVFPNGSKLWRLKYRRPGGAETRVSLGPYPVTSLAMARTERDRLKRQRREGVDPVRERAAQVLAKQAANESTFEIVAREWLGKQNIRASTHSKALWMFEVWTFPWIGARPVSEITSPELLSVLRRIEAQGKLETAQRVKQQAGRVFRYAIATGKASNDPSSALRGAIATPKTRHHATIIDPRKIGPLLRAVYSYQGSFLTACALKLAALTFVRPGELRRLEWAEIDFERAEWRIPDVKMKMGVQHIVPLSRQAIAVLREIEPVTASGRFVFRHGNKPMSENTVLGALRGLGYTKDEMSGHGFRAMASTRLHEMGWLHDVIERQLAHLDKNKSSAPYNYAEYLPERRRMIQAWADYLDELRLGAKKSPVDTSI